jgi:hypothetical protein
MERGEIRATENCRNDRYAAYASVLFRLARRSQWV